MPEVTARASVTLQDLPLRGSFVRLQGRFQDSYVFSSGFWDSTKFFPDGRVPARFVMDVSAGYRWNEGVTLSGTVFNVTNDHGFDVLGAPPGGVLGYVQLAYTWPGLAY